MTVAVAKARWARVVVRLCMGRKRSYYWCDRSLTRRASPTDTCRTTLPPPSSSCCHLTIFLSPRHCWSLAHNSPPKKCHQIVPFLDMKINSFERARIIIHVQLLTISSCPNIDIIRSSKWQNWHVGNIAITEARLAISVTYPQYGSITPPHHIHPPQLRSV